MNKKVSIIMLMFMDILILISGIAFFVYSIKANVVFRVFNTQIPGIIFAAIVIFLGARYMKAIFKIRDRISSDKFKFSWNNFKRNNKNIY
jgi:uncharacterized membrane protein